MIDLKKRMTLAALGLLGIGFLLLASRPFPNPAANAQQPVVEGLPTNRIMVTFVETADLSRMSQAQQAQMANRMSAAAGVELALLRPMSGGAYVYEISEPLPPTQVEQIGAKLESMPSVLYADPDTILQAVGPESFNLFEPQAVEKTPNDPSYANQWHFNYEAGTTEGINLPPAWNLSTGDNDVVVAVVDTGILDHADLAGRTLPGYDFIHDLKKSNDGDGRDADPSDPGDWEPSGYCSTTSRYYPSSWHGTHVAGTIGAASNNNLGVAGVNWRARILPLRALGRCGGWTADVLDAVSWAAGYTVPGVPRNNNPADVINLSLGGSRLCGNIEQAVYNRVAGAGVVVVAAAGNKSSDAGFQAPANCNNVISVAATDRGGSRAYYSNSGASVDISAPGGSGFNGVLSTSNTGTTIPKADAYAYFQGTSMAAPHVAGVASLVIGQNPAMTPAQVLKRLQNSARAFPAGSSCTTSNCGAGIVDAFAALSTETEPLAAPLLPDIDNDDGDGDFPVSWPAVEGATSYRLQQKIDQQAWQLIYEGSATAVNLTHLNEATYCYRVRALRGTELGEWSTDKCTTVIQSIEATPTPTATPEPTATLEPTHTPTATRIWLADNYVYLPLTITTR